MDRLARERKEMDDRLANLNRYLTKFGAEPVTAIEVKYRYVDSGRPEPRTKPAGYDNLSVAQKSSYIGSGAFGSVFLMRKKENADGISDPIRVVKVLSKKRVADCARHIYQLCVELAVSKLIEKKQSNNGEIETREVTPSCPYVNRRVGLYHSDEDIFLVLEYNDGERPDFATRLCHLFVSRKAYGRITEVPYMIEHVESVAAQHPEGPERDRIRRKAEEEIVAKICSGLGCRERPTCQSVLELLNAHNGNVPLLKTKMIVRQMLLGLQYLHAHDIVHRDVKLENLVVAEDRSSKLILDDTGDVIGVCISEYVRVQLIDFGLAKFVARDPVPSPDPVYWASVWQTSPPNSSTALPEEANDPLSSLPPPPQGFKHCMVSPIVGTVLYLCEQVAANSAWYTTTDQAKRIDSYAAGCVLYALCMCKYVYDNINSIADLRKAIKTPPIFSYVTSLGARRSCPPDVQRLLLSDIGRSLLASDAQNRCSVEEALTSSVVGSDLVSSACYTYNVFLNGRVEDVVEPSTSTTPTAAAAAGEAAVPDGTNADSGGQDDVFEDFATVSRLFLKYLRGIDGDEVE